MLPKLARRLIRISPKCGMAVPCLFHRNSLLGNFVSFLETHAVLSAAYRHFSSVRIRRLLYQDLSSNGVTLLELGMTREMFLGERAHDTETRRITRGQLDSLFYEFSPNAHVLQRWWDHGVPDRHLVLVVDGVAQKGDGVPHAFLEMVNPHLIPSLGLD